MSLILLISLALAHTIGAQSSDSTNIRTLDTITVSVPGKSRGGMVRVDEVEQKTGLHDDINDILLMQRGVDRVPEAGSSLLIRGQGLYDNRYVVSGVPMWNLSHFPNHVFADKSGEMIATVQTMELVASDIAGRFSDAPGAVVIVHPSMARYGDSRWRKRPEGVVHVGNLNSDFSFSVPYRERKDLVQLSTRWAYDFNIFHLWEENYRSSSDAMLGHGIPASFGDLVLSGENNLENITIREHGWLAWDAYGGESRDRRWEILPWGMGAVEVEGVRGGLRWDLRAGGAHQRHFDGKLIGWVDPEKEVVKSSGTVEWCGRTSVSDRIELDLTGRILVDKWNGTVQTRWYNPRTRRFDSLAVFSQENGEVTSTAHAGLSVNAGPIRYGANFLGGIILPQTSGYVDPGLWATLSLRTIRLDVDAGIQSFRPDPRGLPDRAYRAEIMNTFIGESTLSWQRSDRLGLSLTGYTRWKPRAPSFGEQVGRMHWDPEAQTALWSRGLLLNVDFDLLGHLALYSNIHYAHSERLRNGRTVPYEWDMPWSVKSVLRLHFLRDRLNFYLTGIASSGLPYRDLVLLDSTLEFSPEFRRTPTYLRADFKFQYNQPIDRHRYLTRYDVYAEITNILNVVNVREYYWDTDLEKSPVLLDPLLDLATISFGARIGFRL